MKKLFILLSFLFLIFVCFVFIKSLFPSFEKIDLLKNKSFSIVYKGEILQNQFKWKDETVYLSFEYFKKLIDPNAFYDDSVSSIILTFDDETILSPLNEPYYIQNENKIAIPYPIKKINDEIFIPIFAFEKFYSYDFSYNNEYNIFVISDKNTKTFVAKEGSRLRLEPTNKSPIVYETKENETLYFLEEKNEWLKVQSELGFVGYLNKLDVLENHPTPVLQTNASLQTQNQEPIHISFDAVYNVAPDPNKFPPLDGVNVLAPTWLTLEDHNGNIHSKADSIYVDWAHKQNFYVWSTFTNDFNPDLTRKFLNNFNSRKQSIEQLIHLSKLYELDGVNLDFENVYLSEKDLFTQYVRELSVELKKNNLTFSIDVTFISGNENWSMFYDRKRLSEVADYIIVMAYDEHWATSPNAGSVASLPWVENGLQSISEKIPKDKLILGIPFYTRIWIHENNRISSQAFSMDTQFDWVSKNNLSPIYDEYTGQNYVEWNKNGKLYQMWLEDETSVEKRIDLVHSYDLAGIASWNRSFATDSIWQFIESQLNE